MATKRRPAVASIAATLLVCLTGGVWIVLGDKASDCRTVNEMLDYSASQNDVLLNLALAHPDDSQQVVAAYKARSQRMVAYANSINDTDLRAKAQADAALDTMLVDLWSHTAAGPGSGDDPAVTHAAEQQFLQTYQSYAAKHDKSARDLQAACPKPS